jgi:hypothetical protein
MVGFEQANYSARGQVFTDYKLIENQGKLLGKWARAGLVHFGLNKKQKQSRDNRKKLNRNAGRSSGRTIMPAPSIFVVSLGK